jgi:hypothetical protein
LNCGSRARPARQLSLEAVEKPGHLGLGLEKGIERRCLFRVDQVDEEAVERVRDCKLRAQELILGVEEIDDRGDSGPIGVVHQLEVALGRRLLLPGEAQDRMVGLEIEEAEIPHLRERPRHAELRVRLL